MKLWIIEKNCSEWLSGHTEWQFDLSEEIFQQKLPTVFARVDVGQNMIKLLYLETFSSQRQSGQVERISPFFQKIFW